MSSIQRVCSVEKCNKKHDSHGYCGMHNMRIRRYGDVNFVKTPWKKPYVPKDARVEYNIWRGMKDRCFNTNCKNYKNYGGRGIRVCDDWQNNFTAFYEYIGPRPSDKHSIDRINNDGNYEPGNVRWAIKEIQGYNRRSVRINRTGRRGVQKQGNKWCALLSKSPGVVYLGTFDTLKEASQAYEQAREARIKELEKLNVSCNELP